MGQTTRTTHPWSINRLENLRHVIAEKTGNDFLEGAMETALLTHSKADEVYNREIERPADPQAWMMERYRSLVARLRE
jgi:hypothetical protein